MGRVEGKVAIVTGAGSLKGLGYAIGARLVEEGAAVLLTDIDQAGVQEGAEAITARGGRAVAIGQMTADSFRRQIDINLTGTFLGANAAVDAIRAGGRGGSIVNISSVAGLVGHSLLAGYNASKGGVRLLSKSLAIELAPEGIRCNSVHPGKIWTGMLERSAQITTEAERAADVPMGRLGEPIDIANCVLFLASDETRYVTGAEFVVDGGLTAQ